MATIGEFREKTDKEEIGERGERGGTSFLKSLGKGEKKFEVWENEVIKWNELLRGNSKGKR
ncbi:7377_t:CDS:2 [Funneliformis geosporum]|nr:7377_t:CDS:2 [Funneliformis geosporum]